MSEDISLSVYLISVSDTALPCVEYGQLVWLCVGVHYSLQVALVLFAAAVRGAHQRLTAAHNRGLTLRMDPREDLKESRQQNVVHQKLEVTWTARYYKGIMVYTRTGSLVGLNYAINASTSINTTNKKPALLVTHSLKTTHTHTDRYAMLGPKSRYSFKLVVFDTSWDDQESRIRVTHFIVTVYLTYSPTFIGQTLHKRQKQYKNNKHCESNGFKDSFFVLSQANK